MQKILKDFQKRFSFPLDKFQIKAAESLLAGRSVLVTAPTGSGKTVIADFSVFDALDRGLKTIYTTPLKALSNQKFRDFCDEYGSGYVGLLTGDIAINPDAPILVMTTEILRNILYQDIRRIDDVMYVVLDECHYMNDRERGTVWEEIIIHSPKHILFVALSATISNAHELSSWIASIHTKVDVIEHPIRPVPIEFLYYTNNKIHEMLKNGAENYKLLRKSQPRSFERRKRKSALDTIGVVKELNEKNLLPAIYFVFSRRGCDENLSEFLYQRIKLTSKAERTEILEYVNKIIEENPSLADTSPITKKLLRALPDGISVHHAGLVPVLRHLVEILFQKNLIKVVFATETLAAGINMPARTTVISSLSKRGDYGHEVLSVNSFMQMTGRAGRRGKDTIGYCVVYDDGRDPYSEAVRLATSHPDPINSNFSLSYNMVLNLLKNFKMEEIKTILKKSFGQYLSNRDIIDLRFELEKQQEQISDSVIPCKYKPELKFEDMPLLEYEDIKHKITNQELKIRREQELFEDKQYQKMFNELNQARRGSVILVRTKESDVPILGALIAKYTAKERSFEKPKLFSIIATNKGVTRVTPAECLYISKNVVNVFIPDEVLAAAYEVKVGNWVRSKKLGKIFNNSETQKYSKKISKIDYPKNLESEIEKLEDTRHELRNHECQTCPILNEHLSQHNKFKHITQQISELKETIELQKELYIHEFKRMMNVLEHFKQIEKDSQEEFKPTEKGMLTAYIRSENDLAISLVIGKDILNDLSPVEIASVLSVLVYEPRRSSQGTMDNVPKKIKSKVREIENIANELDHIQDIEGIDAQVTVEVDMVYVVWLWGNGSTWKSLVQDTNLDDGDIIRAIRRIIDLLHQLKNNPSLSLDLQHKVTLAIELLDRDLISVNVEEKAEDELEGDEINTDSELEDNSSEEIEQEIET
ncbi:MAG: DEAD/DEAH box helicase [Candidatus Sericytochromatia bacterium]